MSTPDPSPVFPESSPAVRAVTIAEHLVATIAKHLGAGNTAAAHVFARELESVLASLVRELEKL